MILKRLPLAQDSRRLPETATAYLQTATHQPRVPNGYRESNQDPQRLKRPYTTFFRSKM